MKMIRLEEATVAELFQTIQKHHKCPAERLLVRESSRERYDFTAKQFPELR